MNFSVKVAEQARKHFDFMLEKPMGNNG